MRTLEAPEPLDLRRTIAALGMKASGEPAATAKEAWWASHTPGGPGSLRLQADDGRI